MATRVTITPTTADPDQPVRVAKIPLSNDRRDRAAEADWLRRAARPGVVPLSTVDERSAVDGGGTPPSPNDPPSPPIVTEHVGSTTLRTSRLDSDEGCGALIELAELLVDLHRDGFVHGKLTPDHVIIGADRLWLCSPDGTIDDPAVDLEGLSRCMNDLTRQWQESGTVPPFAEEWVALAERLADGDDSSRSASRALAALRTMRRTDAVAAVPPGRRPWDRWPRIHPGLALLTAFVLAAVGGLLLLREEELAGGGRRIEIDGATYAIGAEGDDVAVLDDPCEPSQRVFVLQESSDIVWVFDQVADRARSRPVAVVPGATDIRAHWIEGAPSCTVALASGPAGSTIIDGGATASSSGDAG